jgi:hypothetical protein
MLFRTYVIWIIIGVGFGLASYQVYWFVVLTWVNWLSTVFTEWYERCFSFFLSFLLASYGLLNAWCHFEVWSYGQVWNSNGIWMFLVKDRIGTMRRLLIITFCSFSGFQWSNSKKRFPSFYFYDCWMLKILLKLTNGSSLLSWSLSYPSSEVLTLNWLNLRLIAAKWWKNVVIKLVLTILFYVYSTRVHKLYDKFDHICMHALNYVA